MLLNHNQMQPPIHIIECPRDAMQGWKHFIPTPQKAAYLNALLQVGFHTLDCGSFVSPKAIPQMADTKEVLGLLDRNGAVTQLLTIVANVRGAEEAVLFGEIDCLGFPFSISPTFQLRNTNSTMEASLERLEDIQDLCIKNGKQLVVYLSMGFGNPYGDPYNADLLLHWAGEMVKREIEILSLADTVGVATPAQVSDALTTLLPQYPHIAIGVHLHSTLANWHEKFKAALDAGCKRFDGAILGIGGCPMAGDELVGNMNTGMMVRALHETGIETGIDMTALAACEQLVAQVFGDKSVL
jgi:hydroxymethylglutaryl-CoA lyase